MRKTSVRYLLGTLFAAALLIMTGCPQVGGGGGGGTLTANAGSDQTVGPNTTVNLNGSGTPATAGGALNFAWSQTSGTTVTLANANTATASFTSPATAGALSFRLTVSQVGGGVATDDVTVTVTMTPVTKALLVNNLTGNSVLGFTLATPNAINGNVAPAANLSGASTLIAAPRGLGLDANKILQVGNDGNNSITSYAAVTNLANINGNIAPTRNVQGAASAVNILRGIAREASTDLMFVSDAGAPASIRVFTGASTAGFNGNLAPIRTITNAAIVQPRGIFVDGGDHLFIANEAPARVFVYDNASTRTGNLPPDRTIQTAAIGAARDVFVDSTDRLFVVDNANQKIFVYLNGSTRNGTEVPPDSVLTVTGATVLNSVVTDASGTGYITDRVGNKVYSYDNLANRNGPSAPDRTLAGAATLLNQPYNVLIVE